MARSFQHRICRAWPLPLVLAFALLASDARTAEPESPSDRVAELERVCYNHTRQRRFPEALAAARELIEARERQLGAAHWLTIDARLNLALVERLSLLSPEDWERFLRADELSAAAAALMRAGKAADGLAKAEQALPLYLRLLGPDATPSLSCRSNVVLCQIDLGRYFASQPHVRELIDRQPRVKGMLHPDTLLGVRILGRFNEAIGDLPNAEDAFRKAREICLAMGGPDHGETLRANVDLARVLAAAQRFGEAQPLLQSTLDKQCQLLGNNHPEIGQTMKVLGGMYCDQGRFAEAQPLLDDSLRIARERLGDDHLATAGTRHALGKLYLRIGRFQDANDQLIGSMEVCLEQLGDKHPVSARVMESVADLYEIGTNPGMARQVRLQCLKIAEDTFGEVSFHTADALEKLARTYIVLSDFALAEPYLLRAREIRGRLLGENDPRTAAVVGQLAYVYLGIGDTARAEPLFLKALAVLDKTPGRDPAEGPKLRKRLALLYQSQGKFDAAEINYCQSLEALEKLYGPEALAVAEVKVGLAQTILSRGDCVEACRLMDEALPVYERFLHRNDPHWLDALGVAATAHLAADDTVAAERLLARALSISRLCMQTAGAYQSERQRLAQMMTMRNLLDLYLSLPITARTQGLGIYSHVLAWKGATAARQWRDRQQSNADTTPLDAELRTIRRKLATFTLRVPEPAERREWMKQIFTLTMRKETLDQQRAVISAKLQEAEAEVGAADLQKVLSPDAALIDFFQYSHTSFKKVADAVEMYKTQRYLAFIVRPDRGVTRVDLGDVAPIADAVVKWRKTRGFRPNAGKHDWGATVARLVWSHLARHVEDCETLLISPDGALSQAAWNVLPGRTPDRYLIEDFAIAVVPVPQLLPAILTAGGATPENGGMDPPSLLLVGDVDYDAPPEAIKNDPASASPNGARRHAASMHFSRLKGAAAEVDVLGEKFARRFPDGQVLLLTKDHATEEAFWRAAPRHRWLHIATHGFFAPASVKAAIATQCRMDPNAREHEGVSLFHVDYLNGLAFTGANVGAAGDGDDGILTAAELAAMDLRHVDTVVLSGCETGLGEVHGGEGAFGMQRALQIAGVRTTVGSLWTVSDEKTNMLMQRFYDNLWEKRLPRLAALREAQLWLLNSASTAKTANDSGAPPRLSPHYWGAFTLSGDWR